MNTRRNLLLFSIALLVVALSLGAYRLLFLARAERTAGVVTEVWGENSRCGRRGRQDCTRFYALVQFQASDARHSLRVKAGKASGHDRPPAGADYRIGDSVPILFDPGKPERALRDSFRDRWGTSLLVLLLSALAGAMPYIRDLEVEDTGEMISLDLNKPPNA